MCLFRRPPVILRGSSLTSAGVADASTGLDGVLLQLHERGGALASNRLPRGRQQQQPTNDKTIQQGRGLQLVLGNTSTCRIIEIFGISQVIATLTLRHGKQTKILISGSAKELDTLGIGVAVSPSLSHWLSCLFWFLSLSLFLQFCASPSVYPPASLTFSLCLYVSCPSDPLSVQLYLSDPLSVCVSISAWVSVGLSLSASLRLPLFSFVTHLVEVRDISGVVLVVVELLHAEWRRVVAAPAAPAAQGVIVVVVITGVVERTTGV